jgi:hypothetical protein
MVAMRNPQRCQNGGLGRIKRNTHMGMDEKLTIEYRRPESNSTKGKMIWRQMQYAHRLELIESLS